MEPREVLLDLQIATDAPGLPSVDDFEDWVGAALIAAGPPGSTELTVRLTDEEEAKELNWRYRGNEYATNVLSFPAEIPHGVEMEVPLLGDLIICPAVVVREAEEQGKTPQAHWAHLVVHGVLHLLGFDHENDTDAEEMEAIEQRILAGLGFPDPYANDEPLQD